VEASTTLSVGNPITIMASPISLPHVGSAHMPAVGTLPGDLNQLPDPLELYALPWTPLAHMEHSPTAGRLLPAPVTATVRTTTTTTITTTAAVSAAQSGLVFTSYGDLQAPSPGTNSPRPVYGTADLQYQGSLLVNPRENRVSGNPGAIGRVRQPIRSGLATGYEGVGAVGGAPTGTAGYLESSGRREYGSLGDGAGAAACFEQVTAGGYGARPKEAGVARYHGYTRVPRNVVRADQATVNGRVGWDSQAGVIGHCEPDGYNEQAIRNSRRADVNPAIVAGSAVHATSRTLCVWAVVGLAKLYAGVRPSDVDSGIAELSRSAYLGQLNQLRPAVPSQPVSNIIGYLSALDTGTGGICRVGIDRRSCGFEPHKDRHRECSLTFQ